MTDELLIDTNEISPADWQTFEKFKLKQYVLWEHPETGASIALLDFPKGSGIPEKHSHASNQFMYCIEGHYEYTDSKLELRPGGFYGNPKDHPHGPTIAHERSILLEFYDGPHYHEMPDFHTDSTIGKITNKLKFQTTFLFVTKTKGALPNPDSSEYIAHRKFLDTICNNQLGFSGTLSAGLESENEGIAYLLTANDLDEANSIVNQDPLKHLYTERVIHQVNKA